MPDTHDGVLLDGVVFPLPDNFHDDYEGRVAVAAQDLNIESTMDFTYDFKNDPSEMNNIYGQKGTEKLTKQLKDELTKLRKQYNSTEG